MFNPQEPLWLPKGSVRAILALFVVITVVGFLIATGGQEALTALVGIVGVVIGWYFGKRDSEEPTA